MDILVIEQQTALDGYTYLPGEYKVVEKDPILGQEVAITQAVKLLENHPDFIHEKQPEEKLPARKRSGK